MKTLEQMAEEAGFYLDRMVSTNIVSGAKSETYSVDVAHADTLKHFAALVAERCAEIADSAGDAEDFRGGAAHSAAERIRAEFPKP